MHKVKAVRKISLYLYQHCMSALKGQWIIVAFKESRRRRQGRFRGAIIAIERREGAKFGLIDSVV